MSESSAIVANLVAKLREHLHKVDEFLADDALPPYSKPNLLRERRVTLLALAEAERELLLSDADSERVEFERLMKGLA